MHIRPYRPTDLSTLHEIDRGCFPAGIAYSKREISCFVARRGSRAWVAEAGGEIVGFLIACRESREAGHIVTIDVVEGWRRKGVGRALMDAAEAWAVEQGFRVLFLETAEDNLQAQRFYEARGYFKIRRLERYYADGTAAWVMAKTVSSE
jgi:ribosomal protein S18 acetylase RimI-like enzyme